MSSCTSIAMMSSNDFWFVSQSVVSWGACPNSLLFRYFHLTFIFQSIKELGSASLVSLWLAMARPCTKVWQLCTNQIVVWFV
jgi:hypothetical protein